MKRLLAAIIDIIVCSVVLIILRFALAVIQRKILDTHEYQKIYNIANLWYVFIIFIMLFFLILSLYYFWAYKKKQGVTIGKKLMGVTVREIWIGKGWIVCHMVLRQIALLFYPIIIIYYFIFGNMPYDKVLGLHVENDKVCRKKWTLWFCKCLVVVVIAGTLSFKSVKVYEIVLGPLYYGVFVEQMVQLYSSAVDLPVQYIGEIEVKDGEGGEMCEYIFSEAGRQKNWAFVVAQLKSYLEEYIVSGCGLVDLKCCNFEDNFLVCTFGRKLTSARVLDGRDEDLFIYPHFGLDQEYEEGKIYFYCIPRINVEISEDCIVMPGYRGKLIVGGTNYIKVESDMMQEPVIEPEGIFGKWIWAFRSLLQ